MPRKMKFKIDGQNHVGPTLSKGKEDEMVWESKSGTYTVRFTGTSPFQDDEFEVKPGKPTSSGPVREGADLGPYDYEVISSSKVALDPTVFIDR